MRVPLIIGFLLAFVLLLYWQFPYMAANEDMRMRVLYLSLLALLIIGGSSVKRIKFSEGVRYALIWLAIVFALVASYTFRDDLGYNRILGELVPSRIRMTGEGALSVKRGEGGHFHMEADINGVPVHFLIDTGATDIVLTPNDAKRVGIDILSLNYSRRYHTANGVVKGAPVRLEVMSVGPVSFRDLPASVNDAPMDTSLLGMSFLNQFKRYSVDGDTLTLIP